MRLPQIQVASVLMAGLFCGLVLALQACSGLAEATEWESRAVDERSLVAEMQQRLLLNGELPDVVFWSLPPDYHGELDGLRSLGYSFVDVESQVAGARSREGLFYGRRKVLWCDDSESVTAACSVLRRERIPFSWWQSQGVYFEVPGRQWQRARDALRADSHLAIGESISFLER